MFRFPSFYQPSTCRRWIAAGEAASMWSAAEIGRYQDHALVERMVDRDLRDVEVVAFDDIGVSFPTKRETAVTELIADKIKVSIPITSRGMIAKYSIGSHIRAHRDTGVHSTGRIVTFVAYLNAGYEGGEISFPQVRLTFRPKMGDLFCFFSEHLHAVAPITAGFRYSAVWFGESASVGAKLRAALPTGR